MRKPYPGFILVALLVGGLVSPVAAAPPPTPAVPDERIVFVSRVGRDVHGDVDMELFSVRADGGDLTQVTADGGLKYSAEPSPDGTLVAYAGVPRSAPAGIYVSSPLGGPARLLAAAGQHPSWSPLGDRLAFNDGREVFVVTADGGPARRIFSVPTGDVMTLGWSRMSETVGVITRATPDDTSTVDHLYLGNADGSGWREVPMEGRSSQELIWSPTADHFLLSGNDLVLMGADGSVQRRFGFSGRAESFSPDGAFIVFSSSAIGSRIMRLDGTGERQLDTEAHPGPLRWSADGRTITYSLFEDTGPEVFVVNVDGTGRRKLPSVGDESNLPAFVPVAFGSTVRAAGLDRVATAVAASRRAFPSATTAVVARRDVYADALAAAPLAAGAGPVLLTDRDRLPDRLRDEIRRLGVSRVLVMGTDDAVRPAVVLELRAMGLTVERVGGVDRFATAAEAAKRLPKPTHVWLVKGFDADPGRGWEDAVAVSAVAAARHEPILLTTTDALPEATAAALEGASAVTIVGGTAAVSAAVEAQVGQRASVRRVAGADRYATAVALASDTTASVLDGATAWLASGASWADAVAAGPAAAAGGAPLLLVEPTSLSRSPATEAWLASNARIRSAVIGGGPAAIGAGVARQVRIALDPR